MSNLNNMKLAIKKALIVQEKAVVQENSTMSQKSHVRYFSEQTTVNDLLGFVDVQGVFKHTGFVDAFINGHVFELREVENCKLHILFVIENAMQNGFIALPDGSVVEQHIDFRFNTIKG